MRKYFTKTWMQRTDITNPPVICLTASAIINTHAQSQSKAARCSFQQHACGLAGQEAGVQRIKWLLSIKRLPSPLWQKRALNQDDFTSSSPTRPCFISFSCPSTQVRTSKTMLNKSENLPGSWSCRKYVQFFCH